MATACVRNGDLRGAGVEGLKILPFRTNTLINEALRGVGGERGLGAAQPRGASGRPQKASSCLPRKEIEDLGRKGPLGF